jgi:hypothetical protein
MNSGDKTPSYDDELRIERERLLALPGRVAFAKLARLARTEEILVGNAKALLEHLRRMHDPAELLPTWGNQQASEEFLEETERHLHNYVAAAQSRREHVDEIESYQRAESEYGALLRRGLGLYDDREPP